MNKAVFTALLIGILSITAFRCSQNPASDGSGSHTGNPALAGIVYNQNGTRAVNAKVRIARWNADPQAGNVFADSTVTNDTGGYAIDSLAVDTINLLASSGAFLGYEDSITIQQDSTTLAPPCTLKAEGSVSGVVQLENNGDASTVFILFMGTNTFVTPSDLIGNFTASNLAEGTYAVKILTTLPDYDSPMDTNFTITAGVDAVLPDTLWLRYTGIPVPQGLRIEYDTMKQIVTLFWNTPTTGSPVQSYTVYRKHSDSASFVRIKAGVTDTSYSDSTGVQNQTYEYRVATVDTQNTTGVMSGGVHVTVVSAFTMVDTIVAISGQLGNYARDRNSSYYVLNRTTFNVEIYDSTGNKKREWSIPGGLYATAVRRKVIAVDNLSFIYVADSKPSNYIIYKFDTLGNVVDTVYHFTESAKLINAISLFNDTLFFAENQGRNIHAVSVEGDSLFTFNNSWQTGDKLRSLDCDSVGNIYSFCEVLGIDRIQVFNKTGQYLREITADYGDMNISISQSQILLSGYEKVICLDLQGNLMFKFSVQTDNPYISPVGASFTSNGTLLVGFIEGYIAVYSRQ